MKSTAHSDRATARRQRGITLIEACIVLAITTVLASTAAPAMRGLIDARRLDGSATQLATDIQFTRSEAVARDQPVRLSFHPASDGSCYVIHTGNAADCNCDAPGPAQCTGDSREIKTVTFPEGERIALQSNVSSMLFHPVHGTVTPAGTVRLADPKGREIRHVVNIMGRLRACTPDGAVPGYKSC
jgi:type IV fimbrial biogenesis protein FimT